MEKEDEEERGRRDILDTECTGISHVCWVGHILFKVRRKGLTAEITFTSRNGEASHQGIGGKNISGRENGKWKAWDGNMLGVFRKQHVGQWIWTWQMMGWGLGGCHRGNWESDHIEAYRLRAFMLSELKIIGGFWAEKWRVMFRQDPSGCWLRIDWKQRPEEDWKQSGRSSVWKWTKFEYIQKVEFIGFANGSNVGCERRKGVKMSNLKNGVGISTHKISSIFWVLECLHDPHLG